MAMRIYRILLRVAVRRRGVCRGSLRWARGAERLPMTLSGLYMSKLSVVAWHRLGTIPITTESELATFR